MDDAQPGCKDSPVEFPPSSYCIYQHGRLKNGIIPANCPIGFNWSWLALDEINGGNVSHGGAVPLGEFF
ncbi:hypothetical protein RvY_06412 [Ramazzottius varieornatus]|uniref:Uncharacterized protein n=1 Tax=Ramazzottius varieornatus TaxID=947166 RepID=A0A1D1V4T6_RAMVA|nr:hypothetical protein RvY_06412 [Ramazzottius varieornatus]